MSLISTVPQNIHEDFGDGFDQFPACQHKEATAEEQKPYISEGQFIKQCLFMSKIVYFCSPTIGHTVLKLL
jgi:hypothetical protein